MQVDLLVHPLRHRIAVQVVLEQCKRHDQWHQPLAVVLDEAKELKPAAGRPCLRSIGDS
jgi:hypothetical protein